MIGVSVYNTKTTLRELYGRVIFDGKNIKFEGTTCVFQKFIEREIPAGDNKVISPKEGAKFMEKLKGYLQNEGLTASDITTL